MPGEEEMSFPDRRSHPDLKEEDPRPDTDENNAALLRQQWERIPNLYEEGLQILQMCRQNNVGQGQTGSHYHVADTFLTLRRKFFADVKHARQRQLPLPEEKLTLEMVEQHFRENPSVHAADAIHWMKDQAVK